MGVKKRTFKQNSNSVQTIDANTVNKTNNSNKKETKNSLQLILYSIANTLKLVLIFLAILFIIWLHLQLRSTKRQLETKTKEIKTLKNKLEFISKEINNNNNDSLAINATDVEEFPELTLYIGKIKHGHNPKVTVLFASEDTGDTKDQIISLARYVLYTKDLVNCLNRKDNAEFDVYKSCFRDISIELFNSIQTKYRTDWVVTVGVVDNCFMVTDIAYNHEEYFFEFDGMIYFEVFRLPDNVPKENTESVESEPIDDNDSIKSKQQTRESLNLNKQIDDENEDLVVETEDNEELVVETEDNEELVVETEENEKLIVENEENEETIKEE